MCMVSYFPAYVMQFSLMFTGGSSSLLLTTNGKSSVVASLTGGRYGFVVANASLWLPLTCRIVLADSALIRQIYSLTRVAGLLGVIISLVGADVMTPINCQVMVPYLPPCI